MRSMVQILNSILSTVQRPGESSHQQILLRFCVWQKHVYELNPEHFVASDIGTTTNGINILQVAIEQSILLEGSRTKLPPTLSLPIYFSQTHVLHILLALSFHLQTASSSVTARAISRSFHTLRIQASKTVV